jgi:hypothetical protein
MAYLLGFRGNAAKIGEFRARIASGDLRDSLET